MIFISWQNVLTTFHWFCKLWELFSVLRHEVLSDYTTVVKNPASIQNLITLVIFGLLTGSPVRLSRRTQGRSPFHPMWAVDAALPMGPSASRNTFFNAHDHGRQRSDWGPQHLSCPHVGLTLHWAVSVRKTAAGDPVDSDPGAVFDDDLNPRSNAGRSLESWVSPHSGADGVFTSIACYMCTLPR